MKLNEFLAEIQHAAGSGRNRLMSFIVSSDRVAQEEYLENRLLYYRDRALFYEKILLEKDYRLVVSVLFMPHGRRNL